jgi:hypothetical protein
MNWKVQPRIAGILLLLPAVLLMGCNLQLRVPPERLQIKPVAAAAAPTSPAVFTEVDPQPEPATPTPVLEPTVVNPALQENLSTPAEPAGCLSLEDEQRGISTEQRLSRAGHILGFSKSLSDRILTDIWNPYTRRFHTYTGDVLSLNVDDVQNKHFIQKMMDALQVNGYITWLRSGDEGRLHILAIPLWRGDWSNSSWAPYIQAYWQDGNALPPGDPSVTPVLKTPPCNWMIAQGLAPQVGADWQQAGSTSWPDYSSVAAAYLADTSQSAAAVAGRIGWLGEGGLEGPDTMCGPLVWSIMNDAGVFPPGWGGWSEGPRAFWLAMPRTNGRPWSLFPSETYRLYRFREPLKKFDFRQFRLYPGDFMYTYSHQNGFDHMMVITEVDAQGNVYSVTNVVQISPENRTTIERVLVLNLDDPTVGYARNQWATDGVNGRTGHDGFDVFRWAWVEKDIRREPAKYIVQAGDTLQRIAVYWKTPATQIARYNGIAEDVILVAGQELQIPPNEPTGAQE